MAGLDGKSSASIESLLEERQQILLWLDRLVSAENETPNDVKERVKLDYETRLDAVGQQLKGFSADLESSLAEHQKKFSTMSASESDAETRMAEAKLRYSVGEFAEGKWNEIHSEILGELVKVRENLKTSKQEIARLTEVLQLIGKAPSKAATPSMSSAIPSPPPPPAPTSAPKSRTSGFDELAFLKSVTEDKTSGGTRSGVHSAPVARPARSEEVATVPDPEVPAPDGESGPKKSLKCGECNTLNFPTEWYCERCGAELASL